MIRTEPKPASSTKSAGVADFPIPEPKGAPVPRERSACVVSGEILPPFDYAVLDAETARRARAAVAYIEQRHRSVTASVLEIGAKLNEVKAELGHGHFGAWLDAEFGWSDKTAQNYMLDAKAFGSKIETVSNLPVTVVHQLAWASEPVRERVIEHMQAERLPVEKVRDLISEEKDKERSAAAEAKKTPAQRAKEKAKREKEQRQWQAARDAHEAETERRREAMSKAAVMIVERFGPDLPKLQAVLKEADIEAGGLSRWLQYPHGFDVVRGNVVPVPASSSSPRTAKGLA